MQHQNFYETTKEANIRLNGTVVLYDGHPYQVLAITNHKGDGVFRMYLDDITTPGGMASAKYGMPHGNYPTEHDLLGPEMDKWLDANPDKGVIRKMMNSPSFNKFRPFPLGMVNHQGSVSYTERSPTRSTHQGLSQSMVNTQMISLVPKAAQAGRSRYPVTVNSKAMADTILNRYPSLDECLKALADPRIGNEAVAFHRMFALVRGPLDMFFLAYKGDVVGVLPDGDLSRVVLGSAFHYCREAVTELGAFSEIKTRK